MICRHVCEEFVNEGKERNLVAKAMQVGTKMICDKEQIIIQNGGEMNMNDLKAEMKNADEKTSVVLSVSYFTFKFIGNKAQTIYSLVGNQIIRIDRNAQEQKAVCLIYLVFSIKNQSINQSNKHKEFDCKSITQK